MRKILFPALLLAVILTACAHTQPPIPTATPEPTPTATATPSPSPTTEATFVSRTLQATWLEVDETHRFFVRLNETTEPSPITENPVLGGTGRYAGLRVDFCDTEVTWPEQGFSFLEGYDCEPYQLSFFAGDWNFDGYNDLSFYNMTAGFRYHTAAFYFWDPEIEQFVRDPYSLGELNNPAHHPETQTITSFSSAAGGSDWYDYYHFQDGELLPLRKCSYVHDWDVGRTITTVEDFTDGVGQIVFYDDGNGPDVYDEYRLWRDDLSYHG